MSGPGGPGAASCSSAGPAVSESAAPSAVVAASGGSSSAAAAPPDKKPIEPPKRAGAMAAPRGSNPYWEVPGGHIVYQVAQGSLDAHCGCDDHVIPSNACRTNRKSSHFVGAKSAHTLAQGRPIGYLLVWLQLGATVDRLDHDRMSNRKLRTKADCELLSWERRSKARAWAMQQPHLADLLKKERGCRDGEPDEPHEIP